MSHRESGQISPFITSCVPTTMVPGSTAVTIDGTRFGTGMEVSCDAALGTISNVVITHPTATSSRVTFDLLVSSITGTASRTITLSNAGISNGNSSQTVTHGFTPAVLIDSTTPDGSYYDSTDASKNTFHSNNGLSQWDESAGKVAPLTIAGNQTSGPATFPNSAATRGFAGDVTTSSSQYGIYSDYTTGFTFGNGDPWTLGMVIHIPQSAVDLTTSSARASISSYNDFSVGYRSDTDVMWSSQRSHYDQNSYIRKTGITVGTYVIIGTQDGTSSGLKLYVNGVDQGAQNSSNFGGSATGVQINLKYVPSAILGDILIMERALTFGEVTSLNAYWTNKFT